MVRLFDRYFSEYHRVPYDMKKHLYIYGSSSYSGITLFNTRSLSRNYQHPIRRLDDINIRQLLNLEYLIIIDNTYTTLCLEKKIIFFKNNDTQICVGFIIKTEIGESEIPVISIDNIRLKRILNHGIVNSSIFKKIRNNKRFTAYVALRSVNNLDDYLIKKIINDYLA